LPLSWNRSKATALAVTLALHLLVAAWLLAVRHPLPPSAIPDAAIVWLPALPAPPESPPPIESAPIGVTPLEPVPLLLPETAAPFLVPEPDWLGDARDVAGVIAGGPTRRTFGEMPNVPAGRPKEEYPPSIYEPVSPRVGRTDKTPEGETILWVSEKCYIPLSSNSLTMQDFHKARQGIRRCIIPLGKAKPRDDLFEHLKNPPP
jgi:hypothetical protein